MTRVISIHEVPRKLGVWCHPVSQIDVALGTVTGVGNINLIESASFFVPPCNRDCINCGVYRLSENQAATLFGAWMKEKCTSDTVLVSADPGAYLGRLNFFMNMNTRPWTEIVDVIDVSERGVWWCRDDSRDDSRYDSRDILSDIDDARRGLELYAHAVYRKFISTRPDD